MKKLKINCRATKNEPYWTFRKEVELVYIKLKSRISFMLGAPSPTRFGSSVKLQALHIDPGADFWWYAGHSSTLADGNRWLSSSRG